MSGPWCGCGKDVEYGGMQAREKEDKGKEREAKKAAAEAMKR